LDLRGTGFRLTALFGGPTVTPVAAVGSMAFSIQPGADSTITINGVAWTYVAGTPSGNQIEIGSTLGATLTNAEAAPNGGALPQVAAATYGTSGGMKLTVTHDTAGLAGSTFTLAASAASNGNVSGPTLKGNGHRHILDSGGDESPSHTIEIGHPKLRMPPVKLPITHKAVRRVQTWRPWRYQRAVRDRGPTGPRAGSAPPTRSTTTGSRSIRRPERRGPRLGSTRCRPGWRW
jgi:hypothetical protein